MKIVQRSAKDGSILAFSGDTKYHVSHGRCPQTDGL